jgi:hypothetical protein
MSLSIIALFLALLGFHPADSGGQVPTIHFVQTGDSGGQVPTAALPPADSGGQVPTVHK